MSDITEDFRVILAHQSRLAKSREADLFIWWPTELIACCNLKLIGPIKAGVICRWMQMLIIPYDGETLLQIKRVDIKPYNTCKYPIFCRPSPASAQNQAIPDDELLTPGDYGLYSTNGVSFEHIFRPIKGLHKMKPFEVEQERINEYFPEESSVLILNEDLVHAAVERDSNKCFVTGMQVEQPDRLVTDWIFIPSLRNDIPITLLDKYDNPNKPDFARGMDGYIVIDNLVTMHPTVFKLFYKNAFAIDVDDDFKVCVFDKESTRGFQLPYRAQVSVMDEKMKFFFRKHLMWTLALYLPGGDIQQDISKHEVQEYVKGKREESDEELPKTFSAEELKEPLGQAVQAFFLSCDKMRDETMQSEKSEKE